MEEQGPVKLFLNTDEILNDIYNNRTGGRLPDDEYKQHVYRMDISDYEMNLIHAYQLALARDEIYLNLPKYIGDKFMLKFGDLIAEWEPLFKASDRALEHLKAVCRYWRETHGIFHLEWLLTLDQKVVSKYTEENKGKEKSPMKRFTMEG